MNHEFNMKLYNAMRTLAVARRRKEAQKKLNPMAMAVVPTVRSPKKAGMHPLLKVGLGLVAGVGGYKLIQAFTDTEYSGRTLPKAVKDRLKASHVDTHGPFCPCCGVFADEEDLRVDHKVPFSKGGRTSLNNSAILCAPCNTEKGAKMTWVDLLCGRGGRADY